MPARSVVESLDDVERLAEEAYKKTGIRIHTEIVWYFWLKGLPGEYETAVLNMRTNAIHDREDILDRL